VSFQKDNRSNEVAGKLPGIPDASYGKANMFIGFSANHEIFPRPDVASPYIAS